MCPTLSVLLALLAIAKGQVPRTYDMDEKATCGRTLNVDDSGVRLNGRGNTSPSQPPVRCIVYLQSVYANDDGSNKIQIEVESLQIKDCNVVVNLYNGRNSVGRTLQSLSCQYSSAGIFYSTNRQVTVVFSRPDVLVHNEYQFTLLIKPYKDRDVPGTASGVSSLSVAAIIGIVLGCLFLIGLVILFLWCFCTGRLGNLNIPGRSITKSSRAFENEAMSYEKSNAEIMKVKDPVEWENRTQPADNPPAPRLYQRGPPRFHPRRFDGPPEYTNDNQYSARESQGNTYANDRRYSYTRENPRWTRPSRHDYEPYDAEKEKSEAQRSQTKETLVDEVFDSDNDTDTAAHGEDTVDDETLQKRQVGHEKGSPKAQRKVPETSELDRDSPHLERYKSMDLQSQPDHETISSPHHVNAGVRASVEDMDASPHASLNRKKKHEQKSPKSKRRGGGKEPDPTAMPPEAFDPIFTAPITGIDYKSSHPAEQHGYMPQGYPGYYPYGLVPAGMLAHGVPGTQTYAYAYQTVPPGGVPGQQGAWVVQNTPTTEGNCRTAYVMEETVGSKAGKRGTSTPDSKRKGGRHTHDAFGRTPYRDSDRSHRGGKRRGGDDKGPDLSIIARGAAPPDPGQGHRSVAMKSGTDPKSGIHTTQVVWTDTAPDPTDPKPGDNPQVTRKTVTRVTTKSGFADLPPESNPLMLLDGQDEPDFLSPSRGRPSRGDDQPAFLTAPSVPSVRTPDRENIDFYTGPGRGDPYRDVPPPDRTSTPEIPVHQHTPYHAAIRDRITFDDSTV